MQPTLHGPREDDDNQSTKSWIKLLYSVTRSAERILLTDKENLNRCDIVAFRLPGPEGKVTDEDYKEMGLRERVYLNLPWVPKDQLLHRSSIGRILATEGDRVAMQNGKVIVNGTVQDDSYTEPTQKQENMEEIIVPKDHLFLMSDNRDHGRDSRHLGTIPIENVRGKAAYIVWPLNPEKLGALEPSGCTPAQE